ncbi:MAG: RidA family protein [Dehalococcoidia bacterium]|nr:RidA family protein [Dehalococcoidia bacterium]
MADREVIRPGSDIPSSPNPLSPAIRAGGFLFVSGQVGRAMRDGQAVVGRDMAEQTRFCLDNINGILEAAGSSMEKVVRCTVFVTDMSQFSAMNDAYRNYFPNDPPARSTLQVAGLARAGLVVEIEATALA